MKRLMILAVLVALPVASCGGSGKTEAGGPPTAPSGAAATAAPTALKGCEAFTTQGAANSYLKLNPAAQSTLDTNGNGIACEVKFAQARTKPATTPTTAPQTKTGNTSPRRGTRPAQSGCAQAAMAAGRFDPSCGEYQGYLDPGTSAGRAPSSGEIQYAYGCQQGYIPKSQCTSSQRAGKPGGQG
jgi:hypothetical protein